MVQSSDFDWNKFRDEVGAWSRKNFGSQSRLIPLLGMFEEIGEVFEGLPGQVFDSCGDFMIFLADFCSRAKLDLCGVVIGNPAGDHVRDKATSDRAMIAIGRVCHSIIKLQQGIRTNESHEKVLYESLTQLVLWIRSRLPDSTMDGLCTTTMNTWESVSKRDWKRNKVTGGACPECQDHGKMRTGHWLACAGPCPTCADRK